MGERWIINADGPAPIVLPHSAPLSAVQVIGVETPPPAPRTAIATRPEGGLPVQREHELRDVKLTLSVHPVHGPGAGATYNHGAPAPEAEGDGTLLGWTGTTRRVSGGSEQLAAIEDLQQILGELRVARRSVAGTLTRVLADGRRATLDVVEVLDDGLRQDLTWYIGRYTEVTVTLRCLPFWRSAEVLIGSASRVAGKRLTTVSGLVPGDVDADTRIELSGATRNAASVLYSIDQRTEQPAEVACSTLDRPSAATLVTATGSVATQVVQRPAFTVGGAGLWEAGVLLSLSGVPLDRPGRWRIMLRVRGQVGGRIRLRWTAGSRVAGMTECAPVTLVSDQWELVTLGVVSIPDGAGLDGVIETLLPHSQPIQFDQLLFVAADTFGEQHATNSVLPSELLALDRWAGSGNVVGSTADLGGTWTSSGTGTSATRSGGAAIRFAAYDQNAGVAHGLAIGSPAAVRVTSRCGGDGGGYGGDGGIWVGNAAGQAAIAGVSGATGAAGSGSTGAWGVYLGQWFPDPDGGYFQYAEWRMVLVNGTTVSMLTAPGSPGGDGELELTVADGVASARVTYGGDVYVNWTGSMDVPAVPASLRAGIASHGWDGYSGPFLTWTEFAAVSVPVAGDAALFAGKSARHESYAASRVDPAGIRGPVTPRGSRPKLLAAGTAERPTRVSVVATRNNLGNQVDAAAADPLTVHVYATPRWLQIPAAP